MKFYFYEKINKKLPGIFGTEIKRRECLLLSEKGNSSDGGKIEKVDCNTNLAMLKLTLG